MNYQKLNRERIKRCKECLIVLPNKGQLVLGKDQNFTFDYVFDESTSQENLYSETIKPLVLSCLDGYNATVFAYGQTGMLKIKLSVYIWSLTPHHYHFPERHCNNSTKYSAFQTY